MRAAVVACGICVVCKYVSFYCLCAVRGRGDEIRFGLHWSALIRLQTAKSLEVCLDEEESSELPSKRHIREARTNTQATVVEFTAAERCCASLTSDLPTDLEYASVPRYG